MYRWVNCRHRKVKSLAQGYTATSWQSWGQNPGVLSPKNLQWLLDRGHFLHSLCKRPSDKHSIAQIQLTPQITKCLAFKQLPCCMCPKGMGRAQEGLCSQIIFFPFAGLGFGLISFLGFWYTTGNGIHVILSTTSLSNWVLCMAEYALRSRWFMQIYFNSHQIASFLISEEPMEHMQRSIISFSHFSHYPTARASSKEQGLNTGNTHQECSSLSSHHTSTGKSHHTKLFPSSNTTEQWSDSECAHGELSGLQQPLVVPKGLEMRSAHSERFAHVYLG